MRGADANTPLAQCKPRGSPPDEWGRRSSAKFRWARFRFTPHRGADTVCRSDQCLFRFPPHRGADVSRRSFRSGVRITPTCVGQTKEFFVCADPPRFTPTCVGRQRRFFVANPIGGFTPTCVGQTFGLKCFMGFLGSPHMPWGRPPEHRPLILILRFTPTCVGQTLRTASNHAFPPVHPHMRGADGIFLVHIVPISVHPHMRGADVARDAAQRVRLRFTPTCVGQTKPGIMPPSGSTVHPHMRGADTRLLIQRGQIGRFTPTCVGQTGNRQNRP